MVQSTYFVHMDLSLLNNLGDKLQAGKQARLDYLPKPNEIVIQIRHAHSDGWGVFIMFDALLDALGKSLNLQRSFAKYATDVIHYGDRLSPPFHVAAKVPEQPTQDQLQRMETKLNTWMAGFPSIGVGSSTLHAKPQTMRH